ncbi:hypothetical protein SAY86_023253 [Trapa natans]|uniref:Uncharacterized protein n=1 Tax=Trapa natans TaxID=22666 RepID=A0AAN7M729_TRANT|nr:hypothetical protein SAY86_023253 [Trapa natans]
MAKFNVTQKRRRALIAERKRAHRGDPLTGKLNHKPQPLSVSGKRKQKLLKKWRREQKDAIEKGLISLQDTKMSVVEGTSPHTSMEHFPLGFTMNVKIKKGFKLKRSMRKGKGKKKSNSPKSPASGTLVDSMVE